MHKRHVHKAFVGHTFGYSLVIWEVHWHIIIQHNGKIKHLHNLQLV